VLSLRSAARASGPAGGIGLIHRGSQHAAGLGGAWLVTSSGQVREAVVGGFASGRVAPAASALGLVGDFSTDPTFADLGNIARHVGTGKTWTVWVRPSVVGADQDAQSVLTFGHPGFFLADDYGPYVSVGGGTLNVYSGGAGSWTSAGSVETVAWSHIVVRMDAAGAAMFINGRQVGTSTSLTFGASVSAARWGDRVDGNGVSFAGQMQDLRRYDRALSAAEIYTLYDPRTRWDLYAPITRRVWIPGSEAEATPTVRPISDVTVGTWTPSTGSSLYAMLGDDSDSTYIRSATGAGPDTCEVRLGPMTDPGSAAVTLRVRHRKTP
jgi:hypothetical protein